MLVDVILDEFAGEAADGAPDRRHLVENFATWCVSVQCPLDGFELAPQATDAGDQLRFVSTEMGHRIGVYPMPDMRVDTAACRMAGSGRELTGTSRVMEAG